MRDPGNGTPEVRAQEGRTAVLAAALGIVALAVAGALPSAAHAKALASASMNITDFVWYNSTAGRPVTLSTQTADNPDILFIAGRGTDFMSTSAGLTLNGTPVSAGPDTQGDRTISTSMGPSLNWTPNDPPTCAPDGSSACTAAPSFAPIDPPDGPFPAAELARSDADYEQFFADVIGSSASDSATVGLRSEVSLLTQPPAGGAPSTGSARSEWDTLLSFDVQRTFDSYFEVTLQSQALARLDDAAGSATAESAFGLTILGPSSGFWSFSPAQLNLSESRSQAGLSDDGTYSPQTIRLVSGSTSPQGIFTLNATDSVTLRLVAEVSASADLQPSAVPVPPSLWLLLTGVSGLWLFRCSSSRWFGLRSA